MLSLPLPFLLSDVTANLSLSGVLEMHTKRNIFCTWTWLKPVKKQQFSQVVIKDELDPYMLFGMYAKTCPRQHGSSHLDECSIFQIDTGHIFSIPTNTAPAIYLHAHCVQPVRLAFLQHVQNKPYSNWETTACFHNLCCTIALCCWLPAPLPL